MDVQARIVEVDGQRYCVFREETEGALQVRTTLGAQVRLRPFRFNAWLGALERHVQVDEEGLHFDEQAFAREVLEHSDVPRSLFDELAPLALWWATLGEEAPSRELEPQGWVDMGPARARLRPWTWVQRSQALEASMKPRDDGAREFSLERYLRAMLAASLVATEPPGLQLESLDGPATAALIDAAVALNLPGERLEDQMVKSRDARGQGLALVTLKLCKALGWTPSQVWELPAAEVDRLLALLDVVDVSTARPAAPRPRGLADFPDAVVVQVEDG